LESAAVHSEKNEYVLLQLFRAAAALGVLCYHHFDAVPSRGMEWLAWTASYGDHGVIIFFVISGYVISLSAASRAGFPSTFLFQRVSRIYPPYIASMALAVVLAAISTTLTGKALATQIPVTPAAYVKNVLLVENIFSTGDYVSVVYWSLCYEMQFYLLVALALFLFRKRWIWVLSAASLALCFLYPFHEWVYMKNAAYFGLGIIIYNIHEKSFFSSLRLLPFTALFFSSLTAFLTADTRLIAAVITAWMILLFKSADRFFSGNIFRSFYFIGKISYSLYLTHPQTGIRLVNLITRWVPPSPVAALLAVCAGCLFSVGFAFLFYRVTEQYLCGKLRNYLRGIIWRR
jgi:peptidoglycan/LPS O-acetylase OafA/YrhL